MPRRAPADHERIAQVYEETQSKVETARRLGLHPNTVYAALRRLSGVCTRCGLAPALPNRVICEECRVWVNAREARKRSERSLRGQCYMCDNPVDAPTSRMYCREHRLGEAARRRRNIATGQRKPPDKHKVRMRNLRNTHGEGAVIAWERDAGTCQCCGLTHEEVRMCVHHIDIDGTNNNPENLTCLCSPCHLLFHKLLLHPSAGQVIAWATKTYPDFAERFHGGRPVGRPRSTPTGRSA